MLDPNYTAESPRPAKTLLVQPNYEVLVLHPESGVLWDLVRFANLVRHDRVSVYQITKESIVRAIEARTDPRSRSKRRSTQTPARACLRTLNTQLTTGHGS